MTADSTSTNTAATCFSVPSTSSLPAAGGLGASACLWGLWSAWSTPTSRQACLAWSCLLFPLPGFQSLTPANVVWAGFFSVPALPQTRSSSETLVGSPGQSSLLRGLLLCWPALRSHLRNGWPLAHCAVQCTFLVPGRPVSLVFGVTCTPLCPASATARLAALVLQGLPTFVGKCGHCWPNVAW